MWLDKFARDLEKGDQLLSSDAIVDLVQPSHGGDRTYLEWIYTDDGERRVATVDADLVVPIWIPS